MSSPISAIVTLKERFYTYNISTEIFIINTNTIKDPILCVSDLQECQALNKEIFDTAVNILKDHHDLSTTTLVLVGDLYGESYIKNGKRIEIKGKTGMVNYDYLKINDLPPMIVYGNHDLPNPTLKRENPKNQNGTTFAGVDYIISSQYPNFLKEAELSLKNNPNIFVSHDTPLLKNQKRGQPQLTQLVKKYKPKVHIFGHCHLHEPIHIENGILFINCDARFILLLPS